MNENNIQITELRIHIIDLPDFKSTTSTKKGVYNLKKHRETRCREHKRYQKKKTFHSTYILKNNEVHLWIPLNDLSDVCKHGYW